MRAALLREFKKPLAIEEIDEPAPGPDDVLIQVEACGVCHSDLHIAEGDWPQLIKIIKLPLTLGHEAVGRVVAKGENVTNPAIGDRVGVAWIHYSCGDCEMCREGRENLCSSQKITGCTEQGGFAQYIKARASHALKVPDSIPSAEAAPLFCAGVTVYRAIKNASVQPGQRLAVFGIGGLGHLAVQIAASLGAEVIAVDIADDKLELAKTLGAGRTINASSRNAVKELRSLGGVHIAVVTSGSKIAYDQAFSSLRPAGILVVVGLPAEPLTFPAISMVAGEFKVIASAVGTRQDLKEVLELAASGRLKCLVESRPLESVNEVLDEMRAGRLTGRVVLTL